MTRTTRKPLSVFCSYAHRDVHYLEVLKTWLVGLERDGLIEEWHDLMIPPGHEWQEEIAKNLETSQMILLLVTPDFMASQYIYEKELDRAIERHERGEARVIPIIVRPAPWEGTAVDRLQVLPRNAKAITTWGNRDQAWLDVLKGIQQAVEELLFDPEDHESKTASERNYREAVEWAWTDGELHSREVARLGDLANEYELSTASASAIEHEVMGDTKEAILERQELAARKKEREERLQGLYDSARELYEKREWQAVVDAFTQIHSEEPTYPDDEGLLALAHEALETAREEEALRRYREAVESAWADGRLEGSEVERLRDLAEELELSSSHTGQIEREAMGDTKEAQERISREKERQDRERQDRIDELYDRARRSHKNEEWQAVVDVFEQIHADDPDYADPEGLLASAREALEAQKLSQRVAAVYADGQRHMDAQEWQRALECFEEVQRLAASYRDTDALVAKVRQELAPPSTIEVPDLSGQEVSEASSILTSKGLTLGTQREASSDTVPEGQIIGHSPEAGKEVQTGTSVSVTVSSGLSTADVPNLTGRYRSEARSVLEAAGLELGNLTLAPSDDMSEDRVVQQSLVPGEKVTRGSSVHVTLSSGPRKVIEQTQPGPSLIDGLARICANYMGSSYYLEEAIPEEKLLNARSSFPIPATERVIALLDSTRDGSSKYGLAICEKGIRWCNERTSSGGLIYRHWRSTQRGFLLWSEFADAHIEKHGGRNVMPIEIGENNIFFMPRFAMHPDGLLQLLSDLQSFIGANPQQGFNHSGDTSEKIEELGVGLSQSEGSDTGRRITVEDVGSAANHREPGVTEFGVKGVPAERTQQSPLTNAITASNAAQINSLFTLGHAYAVNAVAFSPNRKLLASGSTDATVGLWSVEDGTHLRTLGEHMSVVNTVAFSPDGKLLASGSEDKIVGLWRVEYSELLYQLELHAGSVNTVVFSPDGKLLASGSEDRRVRIWRVEDGAHLRELEGHKNRINAVAFSPDGKLLASGSGGRTRNDDTVRLWRVEDGELVRTLEGHPTLVSIVAFSADGKLLASVSIDGTVRMWRVDDETLIGELRLLQARSLLSLAFSPDGKLLASGSEDRRVRIWRVEDGAHLRELEGHKNRINAVAFSPDGKLLASGSDDKTVQLWGMP